MLFSLKKYANSGLLFIYFRLFKQILQFLQQLKVKKCPSRIWCQDSNSKPLEYESSPKKCPSSIRCWDSNPRHSGHESPAVTTRPGLPPLTANVTATVFRAPFSALQNTFLRSRMKNWFQFTWESFFCRLHRKKVLHVARAATKMAFASSRLTSAVVGCRRG